MTIWVKAGILGPNSQRAEILRVDSKDKIHVVGCGNGDAKTITACEIVGLDLSDNLWIDFEVRGVSSCS